MSLYHDAEIIEERDAEDDVKAAASLRAALNELNLELSL